MSIDDIVARHRPAARLDQLERDRMQATLGLSTESRPGSDDGVITLAHLRHQAPRPRRRWLPAVAAAAAVLLGAGGFAAWRLTGGPTPATPAGGAPLAVCAGTLPASWEAARSATPLRVDGHDAVPGEATPDGTQLISWNPTPPTVAFGLRATDGTVTPVATFPADEIRTGYGTDGRRVVFGVSSRGTDTTDVQLIDSITHARLHLLPAAPMPAGWVVRTDIAILDGYVYWGATPSGVDDRGVVIRYSIADRSYRLLASLDRFPTVESDIRGVAWPTGAVRRTGLPTALNPLLDAAGEPVDRLVTDGSTYAWQLIQGDQTIFHWADGTGDTRTFRVAIDLEHDGAFLTGVSGRFLFFHVNKSDGTESVLDTRTGALAPAEGDEEFLSAAGGHLFAMAGAFEYHEIDTAALRGFACR